MPHDNGMAGGADDSGMDGAHDAGMDVDSIWVDPYAIPRTLRVGSTEGWLPRADDGSLAETPRVSSRVGEPGDRRRAGRAQALSRNASGAPPIAAGAGPTMAMATDEVQEAEDHDDSVTLFLMSQLACDTRGYQRERRQAFNRVVGEVYSPPRVTG